MEGFIMKGNEELEFPRNVYKSAEDFVSVASQEEFDAAIAEGYFASVPAALGQETEEVAVTKSKSKKAWGGK